MKIGFFSLLTLIFVIAKIFGYIDWSWLLVFTPTIIGVVLFFAIIILAAIAGVEVKK